MSKNENRIPLAEALPIVEDLSRRFWDAGVTFVVCGSVRRQKPTIGDLDVVVDDLVKAKEALGNMEPLRPAAKGKPRRGADAQFCGLNVNICMAYGDEWGAMKLFLSGNHLFNVQMRGLAKQQGYKLNQYGLWFWEERLAGRSEHQIFQALGLRYVEPQDREFGPRDRIREFKEVA